jgi:anti-sigma factor RsiW
MRCAQGERLIERYVDEALDEDEARRLEAHAAACPRCTKRIEVARGVARALHEATVLPSPNGFAQKVMAEVYRQELSGKRASSERVAGAGSPSAAGARFYRRLGLSFLLTAGVLAVSLLVPHAAYSTLVGNGSSTAGVSREGERFVQSAIVGAGSTVRGILREPVKEGSGR